MDFLRFYCDQMLKQYTLASKHQTNIVGYHINAGIFFNIYFFQKYLLSDDIISYFIILNSISKNVKHSVKWRSHFLNLILFPTFCVNKKTMTVRIKIHKMSSRKPLWLPVPPVPQYERSIYRKRIWINLCFSLCVER